MSVPNVGETGYREGGTRGGRDRFNWEEVKSETYREHYIGHSLKAPVGLHYKKKDHLWWTKGKDPSPFADAQKKKTGRSNTKEKKKKRKSKKKKRRSIEADEGSELEREELEDKLKLKELEQEAMAQALGLLPEKESKFGSTNLDSRDMQKLLSRGGEDFERSEREGERIKGLGAGFSKKPDLMDPSARKLGGEATYFLSGNTDAVDEDTQPRHMREDVKKEKKKRKREKKKKRRRHDSSDSEYKESERLRKLMKKNKNLLY